MMPVESGPTNYRVASYVVQAVEGMEEVERAALGERRASIAVPRLPRRPHIDNGPGYYRDNMGGTAWLGSSHHKTVYVHMSEAHATEAHLQTGSREEMGRLAARPLPILRKIGNGTWGSEPVYSGEIPQDYAAVFLSTDLLDYEPARHQFKTLGQGRRQVSVYQVEVTYTLPKE